MALKARIKSVTATQTVIDRNDETGAETSRDVDLSLSGQLLVVAEYVDSAKPGDVLHTQTFQLSASENEQEIADRVVAFGAKVRDARVRANSLKSYVGVILDIP